MEATYGAPKPASIATVATGITLKYPTLVMADCFCIFCTFGAEGVHASPSRVNSPIVCFLDKTILLMPNQRGNNRV